MADGVAHIRVAECNGNMWGAVVWEKEPGGVDEHNPDVSKRSRPTLGIAGPHQYEEEIRGRSVGRRSLQRQRRQTYSSTIKPIGSDKLEIQGCVLGFLCGGETWTRIAGPIPPSPANTVAKAAKASGSPENYGRDDRDDQRRRRVRSRQRRLPAAPADVGDICLIPDIARFAH